jgi:ABC-2 type transport system ATP-binding protein
MPAVEAVGLQKRFGDTEALRGVDFEIPRATVLGVLGPNGAGKTTAVRILTTLLKPDAGRAVIDGIDVVAEPRRVRSRIGLTGQYAAVDERLTGYENLELVGRLFHLSTKVARERARELLDRFDLADAGDRVSKDYSGGMRRRLDIAMSLIARPSVLFLDEPTTGLDPHSRNAMWELIEGLVADGMTTLLTTQYLEEAEYLAHDIVVIDHGAVIERGTPAALKARSGGERIEITVGEVAELEKVTGVLSHLVRGQAKPWIDAESLVVGLPVADSDGIVPASVRALDDAGITVRDVVLRQPTLDDVFLDLTGHKATEDETDEGDERDAVVAAGKVRP